MLKKNPVKLLLVTWPCHKSWFDINWTSNSTLGVLKCLVLQNRMKHLGGVHMGKLAPARVSYRDDFVISYHVYMMTGFFRHPTSNVLKLTKPSWIDKNYSCATRSSPPANRFHTETSGRFAFTWYRCQISYRSEILAPVREPGWTRAGMSRAGMTFCGSIM